MALIFLDLDGTLLDKGKPAEGIIETIQALKANGHIPVIATGRVPQLLYGIEKTLGIDSFIAANGNYVVYHDQVIYERYIDTKVVKRMLQKADEMQFDLAIESVDSYVAYREETELVKLFSDIFQIEYPKVVHKQPKPNSVLAFVVFEDSVVPKLRAEFPELVFNRSNRFGYDVNLEGGLKINGVQFMINYLQYPEADVYAIGDGYNDIDMLQTLRTGIAMGNAYPEVKAIADYVTTDVNDTGVFNALKHYGLL